MSSQDPRSKIYSFRTGQSNKPESEVLDAALTDVVEDVAQSLQAEDELVRQEEARRKQTFFAICTALLLLAFALTAALLQNSMTSYRAEKGRTPPTQPAAIESSRASSLPTPSKVSSPTAHVPSGSSPSDPIRLQTGYFLMTLPRGFEWEVRLIDMGNDQFRMVSQRNLNMLGIYQLKGSRLAMIKPDDERLAEFQWVVTSNDHLELIAEPPTRKTGANYLGTTLTRVLKSE